MTRFRQARGWSGMAKASAPASSGNLGPGFDAFALALELWCEVTAERSDRWSAMHLGPHELPAGAPDLVLAAAQKAVGDQPLKLTVANSIPLARGLGSSSAAAAAGAAAALLAVEAKVDRKEVFDLVTEFEGHADNSGAAVYGGVIAVDSTGSPFSLTMSDVWRVLVAVPSYGLATSRARAALGPTVDRQAVVRNMGRVAALIEGLRTGEAALLRRAAGDELHEPVRAHLHPRATELMAAARSAGAAHSAWSGAGPAIIAFTTADAVAPVVAAMTEALQGEGEVWELPVAYGGLFLHPTDS